MKKTGLADSPFFALPIQGQRLQGDNRTDERNNGFPNERTVFRTEKRTDDLPIKRRTKRYSFEFYEDQLTKLKRLKYQAEMDGQTVSLSDLVRQALDHYLQNK